MRGLTIPAFFFGTLGNGRNAAIFPYFSSVAQPISQPLAKFSKVVANRAICDDLPGGKRVFDLLVEARKRRISKRFDADFFEKIYEELSAANRETADATLGKDWKNGRND